MSDYIGPVEVAFASTYAKVPVSTIRITTEPPRTLNLEEAEKSAGFFDFQNESDFKQRFIVWRAIGSNLYLEEYCLDKSLIENSLCICFHGSQIIPGTCIFCADSFLFIYCPTQTAIHKFFLHIPAGSLSRLSRNSVLSLLYERSAHLREIHDSYELNSSSIALRAHIIHTKSDLYATFCLRDAQIINVRINSFLASLPNVEVYYLHADNIFQRMVGPSTTRSVSGMASFVLNTECFSFVLFSNGIIQAYSKQKVECSRNLMEVLTNEENGQLDNITFSSLKIERFTDSIALLCQVQCGNNENFVLISRCMFLEAWKPKNLLKEFKTIFIPAVDVVDVSCVPFGANNKLIVVSSDEFKRSTLLSCIINWASGQVGAWETARRPYSCSSEQHNLIIDNADAITLKRLHIFNPNNYSFDVVLRAALASDFSTYFPLVCKRKPCESELQKLRPNDWDSLKNIVDFYVASPQFETQLTNRLEKKHSQSLRADESPKLKFWTAFEKSCNELLDANCGSIGSWYSPSTGLYGTLQEGRFTVCVEEDKNMVWLKELLSPVNGKSYTIDAFNKCLEIGSRYNSTQSEILISGEEVNSFVHCFSIAASLAAEIIKRFIGYCSAEFKKTKDYSSEYHFVESYGGAFLPGLVSCALRQRVMDRLRFTDGLLSIIRIYYLTLEKYRVSMMRWESALSTYEEDLRMLNKQYRVLFQSLSISLENHLTHAEGSVGDSFFADGGLEVIRSYSLAEEYLEDDAEHVTDDTEDATVLKPYVVRDLLPSIVSTAVNVLWPENAELHLAQYLIASEQYDALLSFCLLNETCFSQLIYAFQFFKAVAYAGLEQPNEATQIFLKTYKGMEKRDGALLKAVFRGKVPSASCSDFFLKVMEVMEKQNYSDQIVVIGRLALTKIDGNDPLLPHVYTMLFKHELATSLYADSVRTLLKNPSADNQKMCLRELIAKLIDCNKKRELIDMDYGCMREYVVEILEARARSADIADEGLLYETLYAFHFRRNNFSKAALSMYEYTNRFRSQTQSRDCLIQLCRLLSVVHQTLLLLPLSSRYLTVPNQDESSMTQSVQHDGADAACERLDRDSADKKYVSLVNIIDENDIAKEFAVEDARLALLDDYAASGSGSTIYTPPTHLDDIISELLDRHLFHQAWLLTRPVIDTEIFNEFFIAIFQVPPYDIVRALAKECIIHFASGEAAEPVWVSKVNRKVLSASEKDGCVAVLRGYVELAVRFFPHDPQVPRSATDEFLRHQWPVPCWLSSYYEKHFLGDYLNLLLLYGRCLDACLSLVKNVEFTMGSVTTNDAQVILPYTAIDQLYYLSSGCNDPQLEKSMKRLNRCLQQYFSRLDSFNKE